VRVAGGGPEGAGIAPELERAFLLFSGPVAADELVDGRRVALVPADAVADALAALESDGGAAALAAAVPTAIALEDGGVRVVLRPTAPLRARTSYALVLSSRAVDADGRPVLDAEGRRRPSVLRFETGAAAGPPPRPVLTEVRADAATPEAAGEYVEIANLGDGAFDVSGYRLAKRTATGALVSCALAAAAPVAPGAVVLAVGGAYDGRYGEAGGAALATCGGSALLGGLANDRAPELLLVDPDGGVASSFGAGGGAPRCEDAAIRIDAEGPDMPENLTCVEEGEGTPGWL
jgi:hypothetical protein